MPMVTCKCGKEFKASSSDIKRGWAKSCSKSCAKRKTAQPPIPVTRYAMNGKKIESFKIEREGM